jgi:multidrug efflux pump subunit AcrA (membrane-fusion protein)
MHPNFTSDKPGDCAICGMSLVKREAAETPATGQEKNVQDSPERKILYYRNPMNPQATSPVPMKDQMGMDYVPVYEEEKTAGAETAGIYISPQRQQLIGVKKEKVKQRFLTHQILSVGRVAYDPELFIAQQEFLQTIKGQRIISDSNTAFGREQAQSLMNAARQKLLLLGMSNDQIERLSQSGRPQENLYLLTGDEKTVWVYITIYEYEIGFIKEGLPVEVEAVAYPGQVFDGKIFAISPTFDAATRSVYARAQIENPEGKLKLGMYVNVKINAELGEKLAVPEDAVIDTGLRKMVVVALPNGYFQSKEIKAGNRAQGYFEVLDGLTKNQEVVTQANFLIDSESRLNAALNQMSGEPNK